MCRRKKTLSMKEETDKMDLIKKIKVTSKKVKRQATDWEKAFTIHISHKECIPENVKNFINQ